MPKLILKFREAVIKEHALGKEALTIGRLDDNIIKIDNLAVSGHHAKIIPQDNYYILVDLNSTNGTFVEGQKITKIRLKHNNQFTIGKHTIVFVDETQKEDEQDKIVEEKVQQTGETVILDAKSQKDIISKAAPPKGKDDGIKEQMGMVTMISGGSDTQRDFELAKKITILGKGKNADIKLKGFFVGSSSAVINKRPQGYFVSHSEGLSKVKVNGTAVTGQTLLREGDQIEIGGNLMHFYYKK
ncbi:MAG: FHA domain-containing protein [Thermodesulfobacteriota bacterium]|nr:FHA domain-containing protein [Thermodesulfobacteriota bacterium]